VVGNSRAISATNLTPSPQLALVDGDIGDSATAQKITDTAIARFGRIDILVNNAVALGAIKTPMHKIEAHDFLKNLQPIGRMGKIDEVVDAVMYLNDAKFVTGEVLHDDGDAHAGKW
jgi:NAD(P)-dependent dehydrogenase (short-subunit alcohol dehydrogenase family)